MFEDLNIGIVRIKEIVDSLRSFSRIDNTTNIETFDLEQGLRDTLVVARHRYRYIADIEINFGLVPKIYGNGGKINQVFLNLIMNAADAIKSAQEADGRVGIMKISTEYNATLQQVKITIEDNGLGMDEAILKSIFNPFFTTKPVGSGTGLGLSVSYDIVVQEHKGELIASSEVGVGTQFSVILPIGVIGGDHV